MSTDMEFAIKMILTLVASGLVFAYMKRVERKKQAEADAKFEMTMKMIELRNKKYEGTDEPKK